MQKSLSSWSENGGSASQDCVRLHTVRCLLNFTALLIACKPGKLCAAPHLEMCSGDSPDLDCCRVSAQGEESVTVSSWFPNNVSFLQLLELQYLKAVLLFLLFILVLLVSNKCRWVTSFFFLFFPKTGCCYLAQAGLESLYPKLAWNSRSSCLSLMSAEITGVRHHAQFRWVTLN